MVKSGPFVMILGLGALLDIANTWGMSEFSWKTPITPLDILRVGCLLLQKGFKLAMLVADELVTPPMWLELVLDMISKC